MDQDEESRDEAESSQSEIYLQTCMAITISRAFVDKELMLTQGICLNSMFW